MIEAIEEMRKGVGKRDLLAEASQAKAIVNSTWVGRKVLYYCWLMVVVMMTMVMMMLTFPFQRQ